ncbi:hypothetical protein [Herbaspirillum rhizosphaerae]|uniref:hypothetical protein n=1 Tax=Herbaspirillum rhizosphaerae TaxID=346179 RepID=UPI00067A820C|nr:hypothetical protein [Herbaspirillum rhizosphaerae]
MKNQQTIVDNKKSQLLRRQHAPQIVVAWSIAANCTAASLQQRTALWCKRSRQSSILVQTFTKLSLIDLFIVDNTARRYDSCSASGSSAILFSH